MRSETEPGLARLTAFQLEGMEVALLRYPSNNMAGALAAWASTAWSPCKGRLGAMKSMALLNKLIRSISNYFKQYEYT